MTVIEVSLNENYQFRSQMSSFISIIPKFLSLIRMSAIVLQLDSSLVLFEKVTCDAADSAQRFVFNTPAPGTVILLLFHLFSEFIIASP